MKVSENQAANEYERFLLLTLNPEFNKDIQAEKEYIDKLEEYLCGEPRVANGRASTPKTRAQLIIECNEREDKIKEFEHTYNSLLKVYKKYKIIDRELFQRFVVCYLKNKTLPTEEQLKKMAPLMPLKYDLKINPETLEIILNAPLTISSSDFKDIIKTVNRVKKQLGYKKNKRSHENLVRDIEAYKHFMDGASYDEIFNNNIAPKMKYRFNSLDNIEKAFSRLEQMIEHEKQMNKMESQKVLSLMYDKPAKE